MSSAARRLALGPVVIALMLAVLLLSPVLVVLTGAVSLLVDRRFRMPRAVMLGATYIVLDLAAAAACVRWWIWATLRGDHDRNRRLRRGFAAARQLLHRLYRAAFSILGLEVIVDGETGAVAALAALERPLVVLSRHAGPGDSFLLAHELLCRGRETRIVLRAALQLDPGIDALGHTLPFCFVRRGHGHSDATLDRITATVCAMDSRGALLLFPEGGNVSQERRRRGVRTLLRAGLLRRARQAARLQHLAAPFSGGALAALRGNRADVVFIAHTGLGGEQGAPWRRIPADRTLRVHLFHVPCEDVPRGDEARTQWLFDWWQRMDAWVTNAVR